MRRSTDGTMARTAACDVRTVLLAVVAFACGTLLFRYAAGLWQDKMAEEVQQAREYSKEHFKWKAVEMPHKYDFSKINLNAGVIWDKK